ncbi:hypothetical protein BGZ98_006474 [Dissophora globulifera]|nr:hypothetical protein BGZ98_006474 [Dissophora globulifera]
MFITSVTVNHAPRIFPTRSPPRRPQFMRSNRHYGNSWQSWPKSGEQRFLGHRLRPYQEDCIKTCLEMRDKGIMRIMIALPVASGKTIVTIDQGSHKPNMDANIIIASPQSLERSNLQRLGKYDPKQFKCIIIDEAHHAVAGSYLRIFDYFGVIPKSNHIFVVGLSATPIRTDGVRLGLLFDRIAFYKDTKSMIRDGWLCPLVVKRIHTGQHLRDIKMKDGEYSNRHLSRIVNSPQRNAAVVQGYLMEGVNRKSTIVFAADIGHVKELTQVFREHGVDAKAITSLNTEAESLQLIRDFRERKFPVIVNCSILTEGTDIPAVDCLVLARPTKSPVLVQQKLGRGMRLYDGKVDCLVLDFVDIVDDKNLGTIPTLQGIDPKNWSDKGREYQTLSDYRTTATSLEDKIDYESMDSQVLLDMTTTHKDEVTHKCLKRSEQEIADSIESEGIYHSKHHSQHRSNTEGEQVEASKMEVAAIVRRLIALIEVLKSPDLTKDSARKGTETRMLNSQRSNCGEVSLAASALDASIKRLLQECVRIIRLSRRLDSVVVESVGTFKDRPINDIIPAQGRCESNAEIGPMYPSPKEAALAHLARLLRDCELNARRYVDAKESVEIDAHEFTEESCRSGKNNFPHGELSMATLGTLDSFVQSLQENAFVQTAQDLNLTNDIDCSSSSAVALVKHRPIDMQVTIYESKGEDVMNSEDDEQDRDGLLYRLRMLLDRIFEKLLTGSKDTVTLQGRKDW